jgi:hypothetical protein
MRKLLLATTSIFCLLMLSACGNSNQRQPAPVPSPAPIPQPIPQPDPVPLPPDPVPVPEPQPQPDPVPPPPQPKAPPRLGKRVYKADWTGPQIGVGITITGDVPPQVALPPMYKWGSFIVGAPGQNCVDNDPVLGGKFYTCSDGVIHLHSNNNPPVGETAVPTFPIITRETFSTKPGTTLSMQSIMSLAKLYRSDGGFGGLVVYNGDSKLIGRPTTTIEAANQWMWQTGNWRSIYFYRRGNDLVIGVWKEDVVSSHIITNVPLNTYFKCRIDYSVDASTGQATWRYLIEDKDGNLVYDLIEDHTHLLSNDRVELENPPHLAFFLGDVDLDVGETDVWSDDPDLVEV